jgi:NADPH-dependent curcumin reductase CurA
MSKGKSHVVDVFFDNVGGPILDMVLGRLALRARVVICGAISQYDGGTPTGPANYVNLIRTRSRMEGFLIFDYADENPTAYADLAGWAADGKLKVVEDILDGLEQAPEGLIGLLAGRNRGKRMVRVGPDPA